MSSLGLEVRMDLRDGILVIENDKGTETNILMTVDDYKKFLDIDDMSEFADNLLQLGRTLGEADNFHYNLWEMEKGGAKTRYQWNMDAIRTLKQIESENRLATPGE